MNLLSLLKDLYGVDSDDIYFEISSLIKNNRIPGKDRLLTESDIMLITYGDSIKNDDEKPLRVLHHFSNKYYKNDIPNIHLLPIYPYTSDDGFSVVDYEAVNQELGTWDDVKMLSQDYRLMFDGVINHISKESQWFKGFLKGDKTYKDYFITCDPSLDYSKVVRPRALPLFYPYQGENGPIHIWATFSEDQVDLNYKNPKVLLSILAILINYAKRGAKFIRLDAIGFLWKKIGTSSIHLEETHKLIQIMRYVIDQTVPGTLLISETNVPHQENISYFGNNNNEASLVYQFPLPPLVLYTFIKKDVTKLASWVKSLDDTPLHRNNTYFNFLASHDGIGVRPVEGILNDDEKKVMIDHVMDAKGRISYKNNPDGTTSPYEMNITYVDAIIHNEDTYQVEKFIASQAILVFMQGMPGIYIHSLLGTRNDEEAVLQSGINRRINRRKLELKEIEEKLANKHSFESRVLSSYLHLIRLRKSHRAFSPDAMQKIHFFDKRIFSLERRHLLDEKSTYVFINISNEVVKLDLPLKGFDLELKQEVHGSIELKGYEYRLIEVIL